MRELAKGEKRKTQIHIRIRGDFLNKGKEVTPGLPSLFHPVPEGQPLNRLTPAQWLADPKNKEEEIHAQRDRKFEGAREQRKKARQAERRAKPDGQPNTLQRNLSGFQSGLH